MAFWDDTYGFLSNVGTARARIGVWLAYAFAAFLVLLVPIALVARWRGANDPEPPAGSRPLGPSSAGRDLWAKFKAAEFPMIVASFASCLLTAFLIVFISRVSLQLTQKYKPLAAFGGVDTLLDVFGGFRR